MKRLVIVVIGLGLMVLGATGADAQSYWDTTGLATSPHDFTTGTVAVGGTAPGLCTFCHTPHRATAQQLIWNRTLAAAGWNFTAGLLTVGGTDLSGFTSTWGGPSPKCLSCHDGAAVIGDVNWFNATGPVSFTGSTSPTGKTAFAVTGKMTANFQIGAGGNLDNNHPVGVPYAQAGGGGVNTYNGSTQGKSVGTVDFKDLATAFTNGIVFYEDKGGDVVQRLTDATQATDPTKIGIECTSCHEPHNRGLDNGAYFLRGDFNGNASTYICVKCHTK